MATPSDKNKLAVLIASKIPGTSKGKGKDKADGPGEPPEPDHEYEHGKLAAATDVLAGVTKGDAKALNWALGDYVRMCITEHMKGKKKEED